MSRISERARRSGKGHAVHETGIHGGPDPQVVGAIATVALVFGSIVLIAELLS